MSPVSLASGQQLLVVVCVYLLRAKSLRSGTRQEFRFPQLSKVLTTSATKLATKFDEEPGPVTLKLSVEDESSSAAPPFLQFIPVGTTELR